MYNLNKISSPKRIIISRTDSIGDATFIFPMARILKQRYPDCEIIYLGKPYVCDILDCCEAIDDFMDWTSIDAMPEDKAIEEFKAAHADVIIHVLPVKKIARLAKKAGIQVRVGTSHRLYHILNCNRLVNFSRKSSPLHEAQLNLKLLAGLKLATQYTITDLIPLIEYKPCVDLRPEFAKYLDPNRFTLIIHPGSKGIVREWPADYYRQLIAELPRDQFNIIITGVKNEIERFQQPLLQHCLDVTNLMGKLELNQLIALIHAADGVVASSTGPAHLGAEMGIKALGLYAPGHTLGPWRWGPIGNQAQYLVGDEICQGCLKNEKCTCMFQISVEKVKSVLLEWNKSKGVKY